MSDLQIINYHGWETLVSDKLGVSPIWQNTLQRRINKKLATNIIITGEPGIGKSYFAKDIARVCEGRYKSRTTKKIKERFNVKQIVFTHSEYMELILKLNMGKGILFDEPSYAMGKRDWFKDLQKTLVHTLESQRFLVHPLYIPIISQSLLDKTIRTYLIQYQIHVLDRGHAWVYRVKPDTHSDKVYFPFLCELFYRLFDSECGKDSCLGCKQLDTCKVFRAQYERKKRDTQFVRYEQAKEEALIKESRDLTEKQLEEMLIPILSELLNEKSLRLDVSKIRIHLRNQGISLSTWKAYQIKRNIEAQYPEKFEDN